MRIGFLPLQITIPILLLGAGALFWLLPQLMENPRELLIGEWSESGRRNGTAEVTNAVVRWQLAGHRGHADYTWVQTDSSPYTLRLTYRGENVPVQIHFNGKNELIAEPDVWDKLPATAQDWIKERNRAAKRPERELRFRFLRVKETRR